MQSNISSEFINAFAKKKTSQNNITAAQLWGLLPSLYPSSHQIISPLPPFYIVSTDLDCEPFFIKILCPPPQISASCTPAPCCI